MADRAASLSERRPGPDGSPAGSAGRPGYPGPAMLRRWIPLAVALAVAAGTWGCGGGPEVISRADYAAAVRATRDRVEFALARIPQARSREGLLDRMEEAAELIERAADDLDGTGSAQGFQRDTARLVAALRQLAVDLAATAEQIRQPGFEELLTASRGISFESWTQTNRALARLRSRGIAVPPLKRH